MTWTPALMNAAVDVAVYTVHDDALRILLIERAIGPFQGMWALPGGYMNNDESAREAAYRELTEETGIPRESAHLEPVGFYTDPERDPRGRVITFLYVAMVPAPPPASAGGDAAAAAWWPVKKLMDATPPLAFDHGDLVRDSLEFARAKLENTTIATAFCPSEFTITELRQVYQCVWGTELDVRNFQRKVMGIDDFMVPTGTHTMRHGGRPAALYTAGSATKLQPPMYRPSPARSRSTKNRN